MKALRPVVPAVLFGAISLLSAPAAWGAGGGGSGSGGGTIGPSGVAANAGVSGTTGGGGDPATSANLVASSDSGYTWVLVGSDRLVQCGANGQQTVATIVGPNGPGTGQSLGAPGAPGLADLYELIGPNGQVVTVQDVCPGNAPSAVPPPPPPPTPTQVLAATPLPANSIDFNPTTLGLTQLPTRMWFTGPSGAVTATVNIRGYAVTTTAHSVAADWWFGDGGSGQGPVGGSESQPSVTHTYVNVGHYVVTLIVVWSGQYTFVGNGVPAETVQLGTVNGPATSVPYAVQEVRSVGVAPGSGQ